ncbi:hypothetical protein FJ973_29630 [Mesorhizobium sp. B2-1-3]|uniref:hypothetical protein n=1 Tax=Mesorhizobium sp. B2-1-3 TaxID=2589972 RepID=UPI0011288D77|nr:hypothetical protein [Mesorhizobium sp. B2-1-3]TPN03806.1 hypothetical protein FJ973_29630 [Mesorhizobium sp. B2-1-3]
MAGLLSLLSGQPSMQPQQSQQPAPQQPQQGGGMGDILSRLAPAIAMIDPRNQQLGAALMQVNMGRQKERKQAKAANQTAQWLQTQGVGEGEAAYLTSDPDALRGWYKEWKTGSQPDWKIQRLINKDGQEQDFMVDMKDPTRMQPLGGPKAENVRDQYGLNPIYGQRDGKTVVMQPSKAGGLVEAKIPEGVDLTPGVQKIDLGTAWGVLDRGGNVVGTIPKDIAGAQAQEALGKAKGAAAFDLPRVEQNAQQTVDVVEQLKNHPGRETATGLSGTIDPRNYLPGTNATNFRTMLDQAKGQTFLQAYQTLKGGGQITEIEGTKAENAIARLNTAQSDEEFAKALNDFEDVIKTGLDRARQQASGATAPGGAAPPAPNAAPAVGETRYGYRFKGGDPSEPSNWEKAQ